MIFGKRHITKLEKQHLWHTWFAWYPVKLEKSEGYAWLENVQRKLSSIPGLIHQFYSYRKKSQ